MAFALVIGAGLSTCLGALLMFCAPLANIRVLAASLGLSAGVMIYLSFAEIMLVKGTEFFVEACGRAAHCSAESYQLATIFFFVGGVAVAMLIQLLHVLERMTTKRLVTNLEEVSTSPQRNQSLR